MKCFEYIRIPYDGLLDDACSLGSHGWEIIAYVSKEFIMKRELTDDSDIKRTRDYYLNRKLTQSI